MVQVHIDQIFDENEGHQRAFKSPMIFHIERPHVQCIWVHQLIWQFFHTLPFTFTSNQMLTHEVQIQMFFIIGHLLNNECIMSKWIIYRKGECFTGWTGGRLFSRPK